MLALYILSAATELKNILAFAQVKKIHNVITQLTLMVFIPVYPNLKRSELFGQVVITVLLIEAMMNN